MTAATKPARSPRPHLSNIGRLDASCPYCGKLLARRPQRKSMCPHCGGAIFVRMRPLDRQRVLLTDIEAAKVEDEWTAFQIWTHKRPK